jgi:hypothetical protein
MNETGKQRAVKETHETDETGHKYYERGKFCLFGQACKM